MTNPRELLNKLKWQNDFDLDHCEIWYVHRGAPDDTKIITGRDIVKLDKSFINTKTTMIPYHRVYKIVYKKNVIFER